MKKIIIDENFCENDIQFIGNSNSALHLNFAGIIPLYIADKLVEVLSLKKEVIYMDCNPNFEVITRFIPFIKAANLNHFLIPLIDGQDPETLNLQFANDFDDQQLDIIMQIYSSFQPVPLIAEEAIQVPT